MILWLKARGEGNNRGWDGWMASPTQWTWVWVNSRSWWWTGRPGVVQSMGLQRTGHDWATELNCVTLCVRQLANCIPWMLCTGHLFWGCACLWIFVLHLIILCFSALLSLPVCLIHSYPMHAWPTESLGHSHSGCCHHKAWLRWRVDSKEVSNFFWADASEIFSGGFLPPLCKSLNS